MQWAFFDQLKIIDAEIKWCLKNQVFEKIMKDLPEFITILDLK